MRISDSDLVAAQRTKLDALQAEARASGDLKLLTLCTLALEEGPQTFDRLIAWVGGRISEGEHQTRVQVTAAQEYVVLYSDGSKRWTAGEVGGSLPNDFPKKYEVKLYLGELSPTDDDREVPWLRALTAIPRVFYFHAEEVAPVTEEMARAPSGLWAVVMDGNPRPWDPLFAGDSEHEAIATWRQHTKSRMPRSRLSAIPRAPSTTQRQPPSTVVLICAAERAIGLTQAVENRLDEGDRVPFEDFYASPLFRKSLAHARTLVDDEQIQLLSARYGLGRLWDCHTRATSDDVPLDQMNLDECKAWARRVGHELLSAYGAGPRVLDVFAGLPYVQALQNSAPEGVQWTFQVGEAS
jgi:uncharacterized protein DUF6884